MNHSEKLIEQMNQFGAHNYLPLPLVLREGKGSVVRDVEGKEYLDFLSCYSALNFGHQNDRLVHTLKRQVDKLAVCSRAFYSEELCEFSKELAQFCKLDSVLAMNTGTEAVETALKLARKWGYEKKGVAENKAEIIVMENNFHGRSISIVSFSTEPTYRNGFGPFTPGFVVVPFGDANAVKNAITKNTVAILTEPLQAEAGILIPPKGYLKSLRETAQKENVLLMFDEIQTGLARTGKNFCFEHEGVAPDVLILGKSLGGGLLPLSAVVAKQSVMEVIKPGQHGSTFGGNPLAAALGREVLKILSEDKVAERAAQLGNLIRESIPQNLPGVKEVRGLGALVGIEMKKETGGARKYCEAAARKGVLCKETHDFVIRIAPPLFISEKELTRGVQTLVETIKEVK